MVPFLHWLLLYREVVIIFDVSLWVFLWVFWVNFWWFCFWVHFWGFWGFWLSILVIMLIFVVVLHSYDGYMVVNFIKVGCYCGIVVV